MDWIMLIAALLLIGVILLAKFRSENSVKPAELAAYRISGPLLTAAERSFYGVLRTALGKEYEIHPKVRVADILTPEKGLNRSEWQKLFNRISSKHFDFALCDPETLEVRKVIELNDASHNRAKRAARDRFLLAACNSADLELEVFSAKKAYSVVELRKQLVAD